MARLQYQNYFYFYKVEDAMLTCQPAKFVYNRETHYRDMDKIDKKNIDWRPKIGLQSKLGFPLTVNIIKLLLNNSTYLNNTPNVPLIFNVLCIHNGYPLGVTGKKKRCF